MHYQPRPESQSDQMELSNIGKVNGLLFSFNKLLQEAGLTNFQRQTAKTPEEAHVLCQGIQDFFWKVMRKEIALHPKYGDTLANIAERIEEIEEEL
ncbi:hypothetical protein COW46_01715 [Candidatus Gracilibacteria bacterium CG17_big_fil_post_rev_8_21_14_2_50_48_13]|nr:MAG: hypothetical protein COW46_01715 [Candidatus Gracilibacteria bacterium CG17_big_fil_post_rev_8_21_14_2_50_48_13]